MTSTKDSRGPGWVNPFTHTSYKHYASAPVYSPNCAVCIDMFEAMLNAVKDRRGE